MDYRLTDRYLDPPDGQSDEFYTERSLCLPNTYWCYAPPTNAGDVGPLPTSASGHITFGCLNNFRKVSEPALATWCHILRQLSGSRLILHAHAGAHRDRVRARFAAEGVDSSRVAFVGFESPSRYFAQYNQIDVALDPFPYPGGTTTCDALWMGVPVVSLAGRTAVSRAGLSILSNAGLPELVAQNPEQYVQIAQNLAVDVPRLTELRATIRGRMRSSPLMNAAQFARDVEAAFRQMWRNWCAARNPVPSHKAP